MAINRILFCCLAAADDPDTPVGAMASSPRTTTTDNGVTVIGAPRTTLRDFYYLFLRVGWSAALAVIVVLYLALNTIFATGYLLLGGVTGARPGSFFDAFCFSVETMGTVGYGAMYPTSRAANLIMIAESVTSLIVTALATGVVFAKFSRSAARVAFSKQAVIGPMDGVPTLMLRVGNERGNQILEATIRVALVRTETTKEKTKFYRMYDLRLVRERSPAMSRSWTVLHPIDRDSPLFGATPESIIRDEIELLVTLVGTDDTSLQPVHARKRYLDHEIAWGARHADILTEDSEGNLVLDVRRFHDILPTEPIDDFPYPTRTLE
jgi:inward rectifier potassium channel